MVEARDPLISLVFRAWVLAYGKTVDLAYKELSKGQVYDGEDCWLDHFGLPVTLSDSAEDIVKILDDALDWLEHLEGQRSLFPRLM